MLIKGPIAPKREKTERWLYEVLRRLQLDVRQSQAGLDAIGRGEAPDGSGNPLLPDLSNFFYLPGRSGGQIAHGAKEASGRLVLSSTSNASKGLIFLGEDVTSAYDETNLNLGLGISTPSAKLDLKQLPGSGIDTLLPNSTSPDSHGSWGVIDGQGGTNKELALQTNDGFTSFIQGTTGGAQDQDFKMNSHSNPSITSTVTVTIYASKSANAGNLNAGDGLQILYMSVGPIIFGGANAVTAFNVIPGASLQDGVFTPFTYTLTTGVGGDIDRINTWGGGGWTNLYIGFRLAVNCAAYFNVTQVYVTLPGLSGPVPFINCKNSTATILAGINPLGNYFLYSGAVANYVYTSDATPGVGAWVKPRHVVHRWVANGPYRIDTSVDGAFVAPQAVTLTTVQLWRGTAGSSGSTTVDLKKNGTSVLSVLPTITAASGNNQTALGTISTSAIAANDKLTIDATTIESGNPLDYALLIEGI